MDTLRNYLENMFMHLPDTKEVIRAKIELGQMMEDRYNDLRQEGRSDNEAVGIVISEFGNLDELADSLGINEQVAVKNTAAADARPLSLDEAKEYISTTIRSSILIGLGVCLLISSSAVELLGQYGSERLGTAGFFVMAAFGIGLIVLGGIRLHNWQFVKNSLLQLDFATVNEVSDERVGFRTQYAAGIAVGVLLLVLSAMPSAVFRHGTYATAAHAMLFPMVGIGVLLFIMAGMRHGAYEALLRGIDGRGIRGDEEAGRMAAYSPAGQIVLPQYWRTVVCIYLCWSFLTFDWNTTWLIWPVAALVRIVLNNILKKKNTGEEGAKQ